MFRQLVEFFAGHPSEDTEEVGEISAKAGARGGPGKVAGMSGERWSFKVFAIVFFFLISIRE